MVSVVLVVLPNQVEAFSWWNNSWNYKKQISFNNSASSENLTNFPVAVILNADNFDFSKAQLSGQDIRFVDSDEVTPLNYEIEKWDATNRQAVVWVKVPQVNAQTNTDYIYMYYGNPTASAAQISSPVWDSNFVGVWHMKETSGTALSDSTINGLTSTKLSATEPSPSTGTVDGAQSFDGTDDYAQISSDVAPLKITGSLTLSTWVNKTVGADGIMIAKFTGAARSYRLSTTGSSNLVVRFDVGGFNRQSSSLLPGGSWNHVAAVYNATSQTADIYINGVLSNGTPTGTIPSSITNSTNKVTFGANSDLTTPLPGQLDEIRISNTTRSAAWIQAEYLLGAGLFVNVGCQASISSDCTNSVASSSTTSSSAPSCNDSAPSGIPDLFQIDTSKTSANLYITSTIANATGYEVSYGLTPDANQYSYSYAPDSNWIATIPINDLAANTSYYFKVKAISGCTSGAYGPTLKVTTGGRKFYKGSSTVTPVVTAASTLASGTTGISGCQYVVQPGDSWGRIAKHKLGSDRLYKTLMEQNPNYTSLHPGMVLNINCS